MFTAPITAPDGRLLRVLFLDIDGVLNRDPAQGLESDKCALLGQIIQATNTSVVLSSTWRLSDHSRARVRLLLREIGFPWTYAGYTPWNQLGFELRTRGQEIARWIQTHGQPDTLVILDDDPETDPYRAQTIQTHPHEGLTPTQAQEAIRRLSGQRLPMITQCP